MARVNKNWVEAANKALYRNQHDHKDIQYGLNSPQRLVASAFADPKIDDIFLPWGRKCGKSHICCFLLYKTVLLTPNACAIYVAASLADAKKILWNNKRLQTFLGPDAYKFIDNINNKDLIIRFKNGSFIQLMGSVKHESANGLTPHVIIYDEFKAFNPEFHRTMSPNRAAHGAKLVIVGTLADPGAVNRKQYVSMQTIAKSDPNSFYLEQTTFDNPVITSNPKAMRAIEKDIRTYRAEGREDIVQREYYCKIVAGGSNAVFPTFSPTKHVRVHEELMQSLHTQWNELQFFCVIDPATTSTFASLLIAYSPYTGMVYALDEVYEKDIKQMAISKIFPVILQKATSIYGSPDFEGNWYPVYDEAGAWAANEIQDQFEITFIPTNKSQMDKSAGISIINHLLTKVELIISNRCKNFIEEIQMYKKDSKGGIRKEDDHCVDCFRYFIQASHYTVRLESRDSPKPEAEYRNSQSLKDYLEQDSLFDVDINIDMDIDFDME